MLNKKYGQAGLNSVANIHYRQSVGFAGQEHSGPATRMTGREQIDQMPAGSVEDSVEAKVAQMLWLKESDPERYQQAFMDL